MHDNPDKKIIDIHAHAFSFNRDVTGCYFAKKFQRSLSFNVIRRFYGIKKSDSPAKMDAKVDKHLSQLSNSLMHVDHVVLLAFDGVYGNDGRFDEGRTLFYVANDYVRDLAKNDSKFLYGASVNPNRHDWADELERVIKDGASLIKWLPNTHGIYPEDKKHTDFYRLLARNKLPLLVHTGREYALNSFDQSLGDFRKLELALKEGVTVIAAHCGGLAIESPKYSYNTVLGYLKDYPNFYIDTAAMFLLNKRLFFYRFAHQTDIHHKILFGSDWPVPSNPLFAAKKFKLADIIKSQTIKNSIERNYFLTKKLNFSDEIFYTGYNLIKKDSKFESL